MISWFQTSLCAIFSSPASSLEQRSENVNKKILHFISFRFPLHSMLAGGLMCLFYKYGLWGRNVLKRRLTKKREGRKRMKLKTAKEKVQKFSHRIKNVFIIVFLSRSLTPTLFICKICWKTVNTNRTLRAWIYSRCIRSIMNIISCRDKSNSKQISIQLRQMILNKKKTRFDGF